MTKKVTNRSKKTTAKKLLNIESKNRLSSDSIESLSEKPKLLKEYLDFSITNTFSELMFRLTHEICALLICSFLRTLKMQVLERCVKYIFARLFLQLRSSGAFERKPTVLTLAAV